MTGRGMLVRSKTVGTTDKICMLLTLFSFEFLLRHQSLFIVGEGGSRLRNLFGGILWFSGEIEGGSVVVNRVQRRVV